MRPSLLNCENANSYMIILAREAQNRLNSDERQQIDDIYADKSSKSNAIEGGAPAEEAIKDIFLNGGNGEITSPELIEDLIGEDNNTPDELLEDDAMKGGASKNKSEPSSSSKPTEDVVIVEDPTVEIDQVEPAPDDMDGVEEPEVDGDGEKIEEIVNTDNDDNDADEDWPEAVIADYEVAYAKEATDNYAADNAIQSVPVMAGGYANTTRVNVIVLDNKFPWILKPKSKIQ